MRDDARFFVDEGESSEETGVREWNSEVGRKREKKRESPGACISRVVRVRVMRCSGRVVDSCNYTSSSALGLRVPIRTGGELVAAKSYFPRMIVIIFQARLRKNDFVWARGGFREMCGRVFMGFDGIVKLGNKSGGGELEEFV